MLLKLKLGRISGTREDGLGAWHVELAELRAGVPRPKAGARPAQSGKPPSPAHPACRSAQTPKRRELGPRVRLALARGSWIRWNGRSSRDDPEPRGQVAHLGTHGSAIVSRRRGLTALSFASLDLCRPTASGQRTMAALLAARAWLFFGVTGALVWARRPMPRRFPPPWSVEETDACFIVRDGNGHALA